MDKQNEVRFKLNKFIGKGFKAKIVAEGCEIHKTTISRFRSGKLNLYYIDLLKVEKFIDIINIMD